MARVGEPVYGSGAAISVAEDSLALLPQRFGSIQLEPITPRGSRRISGPAGTTAGEAAGRKPFDDDGPGSVADRRERAQHAIGSTVGSGNSTESALPKRFGRLRPAASLIYGEPRRPQQRRLADSSPWSSKAADMTLAAV